MKRNSKRNWYWYLKPRNWEQIIDDAITWVIERRGWFASRYRHKFNAKSLRVIGPTVSNTGKSNLSKDNFALG